MCEWGLEYFVDCVLKPQTPTHIILFLCKFSCVLGKFCLCGFYYVFWAWILVYYK